MLCALFAESCLTTDFISDVPISSLKAAAKPLAEIITSVSYRRVLYLAELPLSGKQM